MHGAFGTREITQTNAKGHPDFPLSDEELLEKFRANLRYAQVDPKRAEDIARGLLDLDALPDVRSLADAIAGAIQS